MGQQITKDGLVYSGITILRDSDSDVRIPIEDSFLFGVSLDGLFQMCSDEEEFNGDEECEDDEEDNE